MENYRSLRQLFLPLARLTVVTGPNGSGKSSLYRSLRLLADAARNGAVAALAREGGLPSTVWAGPDGGSRFKAKSSKPVQGTTRTGPVSLRLGFAGDLNQFLAIQPARNHCQIRAIQARTVTH